LYYNDVRKFGRVRVVKKEDVEKTGLIGKLGPEVFKDLNLEKFTEIISKTKKPIKVVLMDQEKMAGVGNIYANDALWLAKINPKKPANSLCLSEQSNLFNAIEDVLKEGIKRGGASELAFVTPEGGEGEYQEHTLVYGKEGKLCTRCKKAKIEKFFLSSRGTYFCPVCQF
jgi:formamidopyrimidine-DNA glycosylase